MATKTKEADREKYTFAADELEVVLRRAYPGSLEKAEVADTTGLNSADLRGGLAILKEDGKLRETDDGFAYAMPEDRGDGPAPEPSEPEGSPEDAPEAPSPAAHDGPFYRAVVEVVAEISASRGENRDSTAAKDAEAFREFVTAKLADAGVPVGATLVRVEAFDAPREVPLP